ncbi:restriction endonuclease [Leptospira sp. 85282-16]|uniref:Restriction endonuclease n=1 Tax=Leptospira montravelensis TaxID=2484961 RepID=A0ABY2LL12_9LEPT|nr:MULTISPECIES: restriction endonuclease [Leptospira]MCT8335911.1 restriction endonuclease [Leptospira sp. 85282-16]TGK86126.1 restriction endonuclease [Leptospira montravelensis]TGK95010.1 restriction endonuclease [Leptospira montravelensis]
MKTWMIRAGEDGYLFDEFNEKNLIGIGWNEVGDLKNLTVESSIEEKVRMLYPDYKEGKIISTKSQLKKFVLDFSLNDYVITYNPNSRIYLFGKITGDYQFIKNGINDYYHNRKVEWIKTIGRDRLLPSTKNTLGSSLTIFELTEEIQNEFLNLDIANVSTANTSNNLDDSEELQIIKEDFELKAHEFIKDRISKISWEEMQELVAGLLKAMGYKARVSKKGPDRGRDIIASPDGLGLEEPRIVVEVKHRTTSMGVTEVRSFLGGLREKDRGIFVSTSGFTKETKYEAERSVIPCTLVDLDHLVELIIDNYDNFDPYSRSILPLKKLYWPQN